MKKYQLQNVTLDDEVYFPAYVVVGEDWNGFALPYFTLEQGKRLCEYLNAQKRNQWVVMNLTDQIVASPQMSRENAGDFMRTLQSKFKKQGYYLDSNGIRIKPESVTLELRFTGSESSESFYDESSDSFIIQELLEEEEYEPVEYTAEDILVDGNTLHVYPIGTSIWIWSVATQLN